MAGFINGASTPAGDLRATVANGRNRGRLHDPKHNVSICAAAAAMSALLYEISATDQRFWPAALIAPLPILATAPELPIGRAAQFAFLAYFFGNLASWGGESFALPLMYLFAAHAAGAIVFATMIAASTEATRRWSGVLAALLFPTLISAFYFTLANVSKEGTWGSIAYSQVDFSALLQTASVLGMPGIIFVMSLLSSGLAIAWYRRGWNMSYWTHPAILALSVFGLAVALGGLRLWRTPTEPSVRVGLVASDRMIAQFESEDVGDAAEVVTMYAALVRNLVEREHPQVVVLPEKIVGVTPRYEQDVLAGFSRIASMSHVWLVVGVNEIGRTPKRNAAYVFDPDGKLVTSYLKHHLVPSLEFDYQPGSKSAIFDAPWGRSAVLICKDLDFPATTRMLALAGVQVVLAPAWDWPGSEMVHQRMSVVRGVEMGFSLARAARQGFVSATDSRGQSVVERETTQREDAVAVVDLPLGRAPTLYARTGDWFGQLMVMSAILLMLRLAVSIWYAAHMRRRRTLNKIVPPAKVLEVDMFHPQQNVEEERSEIYRPPPRPTG